MGVELLWADVSRLTLSINEASAAAAALYEGSDKPGFSYYEADSARQVIDDGLAVDAVALAAAVGALDGWLSSGGALPTRWVR